MQQNLKCLEEVNRKCRPGPRNTIVQLSNPYNDPQSHNARVTGGLTDEQTVKQTDDSMMLTADHMIG